ncbi:hypothetical protein B0G77_6840 [Paraburkholderia sp. BL10I2N1]|nr:hypothetical protein B0G77_6840 [Paraburkholderia sp. BL10I2N1]
MSLTVNLDGVRHAYGLCFVRAPWAYFTRLPLHHQCGDRWDLSPYETHAGEPYDDSADQILKVAFDGPLFTPTRAVTARHSAPSRSIAAMCRGCAPKASSAAHLFISRPVRRLTRFWNPLNCRVGTYSLRWAGAIWRLRRGFATLDLDVRMTRIAEVPYWSPQGHPSIRFSPLRRDGHSTRSPCRASDCAA